MKTSFMISLDLDFITLDRSEMYPIYYFYCFSLTMVSLICFHLQRSKSGCLNFEFRMSVFVHPNFDLCKIFTSYQN